jgi:hypothetical protein
LFQPEVPGRAIVFASRHPRRASTYRAVLAQKIVPGLLDWYLAKTGYGAHQTTTEPALPDRPDNLLRPLDADEDQGAHGRFDARAASSSPILQATMHREAVAASLAAVLALLAGLRTLAHGKRN